MTTPRFLDEVHPFRLLGREDRASFAPLWVRREAAAGEALFLAGTNDARVWVLEHGSVLYGNNKVRAFQLFGEKAAILETPRDKDARAETACVLWSLEAESLRAQMRSSPVLAREIGRMLREDQGIFHPLDAFTAEVKRGLLSGWLSIRRLSRLYAAMQPALHPGLENTRLDTGALSYAVRRLPVNVTSTPAWYLTDELPPALRKADKLFESVESAARRRGAWEMFPGKNLVVIRNGLTDALDLVSCLCAFAAEARKIRHRAAGQQALARLQEGLEQKASDGKALEILQEMGFDTLEATELQALWKETVLQRVWDMILLHEDLFLLSQKQTDIYHGRRTERWTSQIVRGAETLLGMKQDAWPDDLEVHLISSNTHSVTNCLSPAIRGLYSAVHDWARDTRHPFLEKTWNIDDDRFYALLGAFLRHHKEHEARNPDEVRYGILRLNDTTATGIQAQVIDTSQLDPSAWDEKLPRPPNLPRRLIINIDYAFGEQAEEILRGLMPSLRRHIKGFHVIGKAGALVGKRGDILVPNAFLHQREDRLFPLPQPYPFPDTIGEHQVHKGVLLTVEGTLLQNRPMLRFYQTIHQTVGLEMEGYYYAREIQHLIQLGILPEGLRQNYLYYTSDLPMEAGSNLSKPMEGFEGIPPLYALTRRVLTSILA